MALSDIACLGQSKSEYQIVIAGPTQATGVEVITTWGPDSGLQLESHIVTPFGCVVGPNNDICFNDNQIAEFHQGETPTTHSISMTSWVILNLN